MFKIKRGTLMLKLFVPSPYVALETLVLVLRLCMQDTVLAGYHIPAGTDVVYLSWLMARDQVTITYFSK